MNDVAALDLNDDTAAQGFDFPRQRSLLRSLSAKLTPSFFAKISAPSCPGTSSYSKRTRTSSEQDCKQRRKQKLNEWLLYLRPSRGRCALMDRRRERAMQHGHTHRVHSPTQKKAQTKTHQIVRATAKVRREEIERRSGVKRRAFRWPTQPGAGRGYVRGEATNDRGRAGVK